VKIDRNSTLGKFVGHVVPNVVRPLHALWHEIIGFLFLVLAFILGGSAFKAIRAHDATLGRILISVFLPLLLAYFGITSFLRARKISRS